MIVTLTQVDKQVTFVDSNGKSHQVTVLHHTSNGQPRQERIFAANAELYQKANALEAGQTINLKKQQRGNFWNVVDITTDVDITKQKQYKPKNNYNNKASDNLGMRVGNITTNATSLVAAGAASTLEEAEDMVIAAQTRIEQKLKGNTNSTTATANPVEATAPKYVIDDSNEPF